MDTINAIDSYKTNHPPPPVFYRLYDTVEAMITDIRKDPSTLPTKVVGVFNDIPDAHIVVGGTLVPALEHPSYWSKDIPVVTFLMGETGYILMMP